MDTIVASALRILHLEDNPEDVCLIEQTLTKNGINPHFVIAANLPQFLSALDKGPYDLVLADNTLPGTSSLQAFELVRQKLPNTPFICISGNAHQDQITKCLKAGVTDYIHKDSPWNLVTAIRREQENLRLRKTNLGMQRLVSVVQELSLARDLNAVMAIVRRAARELTGADGATFVLRDGNYCYYADEDAIEPLWKGQRFPLEICVSGWAMLNRRPAVIEDIYADPRVPAAAYRPTFVKSLAMVPIRTEAPIGSIGNYWATKRMPTPEEVALLQALANTTAVAMENVQVYSELEQRVRERTINLESANANLEIANRELDSFSNAVAHDLGAPLRAIRNFSELLADECGNVLNENGKRYLDYVQNNANKMSNLMRDLLRLSKVVRSPLKKQKVNLTALAQNIIGELAMAAPERSVKVRISEGMEADGDPGLLRIVLENLLSNAWKYTGKKPHAEIEFGVRTREGEAPVYFVKDNGAGFDPELLNRLFQPFQRLHCESEFAGTGIGLTTVQRIVARHGGRIWAEAQADHGATFFFTLENKAPGA